MDHLAHVGGLGLGSRLKRLSDQLMRDVGALYEADTVAFEPRWFPLFHLLVARPEGVSVAEAAGALGVSHANVSQVARAMEAATVLSREPDPEDRRRTRMRLTDEGRGLARAVRPLWARIEGALFDTPGMHALLVALSAVEGALAASPLAARARRAATTAGMVEIVPWFEGGAAPFEALNRQWIEARFAMEEKDREILGNPQETIIAPGGEVWFARVDGVEVGTLALVPKPDGWVELAKMAVTPRVRGQGVGRRLLVAAARACRRR